MSTNSVPPSIQNVVKENGVIPTITNNALAQPSSHYKKISTNCDARAYKTNGVKPSDPTRGRMCISIDFDHRKHSQGGIYSRVYVLQCISASTKLQV